MHHRSSKQCDCKVPWFCRSWSNRQCPLSTAVLYVGQTVAWPRHEDFYPSLTAFNSPHQDGEVHAQQGSWQECYAWTVPRYFGICNNGLQVSRKDIQISYRRFEDSLRTRIFFTYVHIRSAIPSYSSGSDINHPSLQWKRFMWAALTGTCWGTTVAGGNGKEHCIYICIRIYNYGIEINTIIQNTSVEGVQSLHCSRWKGYALPERFYIFLTNFNYLRTGILITLVIGNDKCNLIWPLKGWRTDTLWGSKAISHRPRYMFSLRATLAKGEKTK